MRRPLRRTVVAALLLATCGLAAPRPGALGERGPFVDAPLDPSLRISLASAFLGRGSHALRPGEWIAEVTGPPEVRRLSPLTRPALYAALRAGGATELRLEVAGASERRSLALPVVRARPLDRLRAAWPLPVAAAGLLVFASAVALRSPRASAVPLAAVAGCLGAGLLGELDRLLPASPGWLVMPESRARLAVGAWTLLPAALLHLALRIAGNVPRFSSLRAAAAPYAICALPGAIVQLRLDDPAWQAAGERLAVAASLAAIGLLAAAAARRALDRMRPVSPALADLERGLRDRQRVLEAAQGICAADEAAEILERIAAFAGDEGRSARWCEASAKAPLVGRVQMPDGSMRNLAVGRVSLARAQELAPQLDALCAFAGIALARLSLLGDLKREVERQAAELAEIRSRRLHAEFVRGVAHELRKPVEELRQRAEALPALPRLAAERSRLQALGRELARRLDLLLFHAGIRLDRRRTDLVGLAGEAVEAARSVSPERDFWVLHEPPALPVLADPSRLLSVLENLLDNAVKATRAGQRITLRSRLERARRGAAARALIEIEDEGAEGIHPSRIAQIFEPGVAFAPGGFGLGLSLCREIVRLHGGTLEVESRPGRTLFRFRLPLFASAQSERAG